MPLARILTFDPGDAADLAHELQNLGFAVEITNPNEHPAAQADLEIEFAICDQQQVLGRAAAIATELQSQVVVFPSALPHLPKPIPAITENASFSPESSPGEDQIEAPAIDIGEPTEPSELLPPHLPDGQPAFGATLRAREKSAQAFVALAGWLRGGLQHFKTALAGGMTRLRSAASSTGNGFMQSARRLGESSTLYMSQTRAKWDHALAELSKKREEAAQRAAALEQQRRQQQSEVAMAAAREQERQKQPTLAKQEQPEQAALVAAAQRDELERIQAEKEKLMAEIERLRSEAREQARLSAENPELRVVPKETKTVRRRNGRLRGAFAGAMAATLLFLVGMVLANFQSMIPVSHSLKNGSMEEQVPFGATTVHGPPGVTIPVTPKAVIVSSVPSPQAPPAQAKPRPGRSSATAKPDPQWHHFQHSSSTNQNDFATDDVVVRHFGPPTKGPAQTAQRQAGPKRYSDE